MYHRLCTTLNDSKHVLSTAISCHPPHLSICLAAVNDDRSTGTPLAQLIMAIQAPGTPTVKFPLATDKTTPFFCTLHSGASVVAIRFLCRTWVIGRGLKGRGTSKGKPCRQHLRRTRGFKATTSSEPDAGERE